MSGPGRPESLVFEGKYQKFLLGFNELRARFTKTASCGREFVLVNEMRTSFRQKPGELQELYRSAHLSKHLHPPERREEDLEQYFGVFCTLITLGCGDYLPLFCSRGLDDTHLPISPDSLSEHINPVEIREMSDFHERFNNEQYRWCPFELDFGMNRILNDRICPVYKKRQIVRQYNNQTAADRDATLWEIHVPQYSVSQRLREKMKFNHCSLEDPEANEIVSMDSSGKRKTFHDALTGHSATNLP
jgi:hypothetical protein